MGKCAMMKVKTIKLEQRLISSWKKKYGKLGDQRIRELMFKDLGTS